MNGYNDKLAEKRQVQFVGLSRYQIKQCFGDSRAFRIISINRGKLARAGLLTVPAVARSEDRPQLPNLLR